MNNLLEVFLLSMAPISELRGAIPLGIAGYNISVLKVVSVSILGNTFIALIILNLLGVVSNFLSKHFSFFEKFFNNLFEKTKKKHSDKFENYRDLALITLVGIPLPFTGAWTACICAFVFNIPTPKALFLIFIGILIASAIVTLLTLGIISI